MEASLRLARLCRLQAAQRLTAWLKRRAKTGGLRPQPPQHEETKKRGLERFAAAPSYGGSGLRQIGAPGPHPSPRKVVAMHRGLGAGPQ